MKTSRFVACWATELAVPGYMFYLYVIDIGVEEPEF